MFLGVIKRSKGKTRETAENQQEIYKQQRPGPKIKDERDRS